MAISDINREVSMTYELQEAGAAFRVVYVVAGRVVRIVAVRAHRDDAERTVDDLMRFNALFDKVPTRA